MEGGEITITGLLMKIRTTTVNSNLALRAP
jgi:hypothetical protein